MKLQLKFILMFLAVSLSSVIIGYVAIVSSRESLENSIGHNSVTFSSKIMGDIDEDIYNKIILFETLTNTDSSRNAIIDSNNEFSKIANIDDYLIQKQKEWISGDPYTNTLILHSINNSLSNQLKSTSQYLKDTNYYSVIAEMVITNEYGATIAATGQVANYAHNDQSWWQESKLNYLYVGTDDLNPQRDALDFGMRIDDNDGKFIGARKVVMNLDEIINVIKDAQRKSEYKSSEIMLLTPDGKLIYSTKNAKIFDDLSGSKLFKSITQKNGFVEYDENQKTSLIAYSKSMGFSDYRGLGWILVLKYDTNEILKPVSDLTNFITYITIAIVIIASLLSIFISRQLSRRITSLRNAANNVAEGDFAVKVDLSGNDEIHDLAKDIDLMAKRLDRDTQILLKSERLSAIGELAARVAHDLRNPLNIIKNGLELLIIKNPNMDEKSKEIIARIERSIFRMSHQIEEVLDYVRVKPLEFYEHSIRGILHNVVEHMEIPETVKITLPDNDVIISCDSEKMRIVFSNIITNAIQAMENVGSVDITMSEDAEYTIIKIIDSGKGIPVDLLSTIFEPLVTTKQKGTGLGLVSCKNIVERHNGSISAKNNPTTFTIRLPKKNLQTMNDRLEKTNIL
ncbi:MAG: sensor histidine kinase [Thaumarchaeota archaeon]|nr:sensor histidine kinase [Nitrososphaerota archaeon]